jgi:hypothetical protein
MCLHPSNGCRYCHEPCSPSCWVYLGPERYWIHICDDCVDIPRQLPDLISEITPIDHHIRMQKYDSNCTSRTNWFDLAGTHCTLSEPEPLNTFESIEGLLNTEVDNICLPAYFWERSDTPYPWNLY